MSRENAIRILWLTDIHYSAMYRKEIKTGRFLNFRNEFYGKVLIEHKEHRFRFIFLTGDLAQNGSSADYKCFWDTFLKGLLDALLSVDKITIPRIICVPGNHDVQWGNGDFLKEYVRDFNFELKTKVDQNYFLKTYKDKFLQLFHDYTAFLEAEGVKEKYKAFFDLQDGLTVSQSYNDHRLYGHIIDYRSNLIIILFNSAWYSLGDKFNKLYAEKVSKAAKGVRKRKFLEGILRQKDSFSEYNNQVTGVMFLENDTIQEILDQYPDYLVVTCMHHPMNWLGWKEYYSYDTQDNSVATQFRRILEKTDVLLTGHEHVPVTVMPQTTPEGVLHIKGGCFIFDKQHEAINLKDTWFSILDLDVQKEVIWQKRWSFSTSKDSTQLNWNMGSSIFSELQRDKKKYKLKDERLRAIRNKVDKFNNAEKVQKYASMRNWIDRSIPEEFKSDEQYIPFTVYLCRERDKLVVILLATESDFYKRVIDDKSTMAYVKSLFSLADNEEAIFYLLIVDIFALNEDKFALSSSNADPGYSLERIVNESDRLFDQFRHNLFIGYELEIAKDVKIVLPQKLESYYHIKMVNHILPYWILERYAI